MEGDPRSNRPNRARLGLGVRLLFLLCGVAALSTGLALGLQDRALSGDLRGAAQKRVERAAASIRLLADAHLSGLEERYRAISRTPALRATLEVGDGPTLAFYAETLRSREQAAAIAILDQDGDVSVLTGEGEIARRAIDQSELRLFESGGRPFAVASVALETAGEMVGRLVVAEALHDAVLRRWAELIGADVTLAGGCAESARDVVRVIEPVAGLDLCVAVSLRDEQQAIENSRLNLLEAGGFALALAFVVSIVVSRGLVRPITAIQQAARRIGRGDFEARVDASRSDEIGDVARAVDEMGDRLAAYRHMVEEQTRQLRQSIVELECSQDDLANAQRLAQMGSWYLDLESGALHGSDEFRQIMRLSDDVKPTGMEALVALVHEDDRDDLRQAFDACLDGAVTMRMDCRVPVDDSSERVLHVQAQLQEPAKGRGRRLEGTVQDVTERRRSEEQIRYLHHHDPLTGLGNRLLCSERLEIQIKQAHRAQTKLGVLVVAVDRFKRINDTLGPSVGDALLKGIAGRLVTIVRETGRIGRQDAEAAISRLGSDEFAVVLHEPGATHDLAIAARRILAGLARPFELGGHEVVVGASIGITTYPDDGEDVEVLLQNAAAAMAHAKQQGGGNFQFYAESMNEESLRRLIIEGELRHALDREEFELHYQPKICLASGRVAGAEALVRWRDANGQPISPAVFIPIAEETGLISRLGDWVMRTAARQIASWQEQGLDIAVSVNLSIHQFRGAPIADRVNELVREFGFDASLLELEITESTLMHDERSVVSQLETLRELGVRVSVDDFGTGYSSFAYLRRLPADAIKIDRSFVVAIADSRADAALAESIVSMGRALGLEVIAEGVETAAQRDLLAGYGCDLMQGFLVSPAVPAARFQEIVDRLGWKPAPHPPSSTS